MRTICVIGLHLLLLIQIAQSFVLLTANIDDIKKLAKKFVSESLAEKIADFIAKATEQMITNVSDENDRNTNRYQDISHENNAMYNIARQRNQKMETQRPKTKRPTRKITRTTKTARTTKRAQVREYRPKRIERYNLKSAQNITKGKEEKKYEKPRPAKQYSYTIKERPRPKTTQDQPRLTEIPNLDSTIGVAEKMMAEEPRSKSKFLGPNLFQLTANSKENGTIEPNDFENIQRALTTMKQKNEFDQYDNPKYPKPVLIATSGPVVLPKIPSDEWWGKDTENHLKSNKHWD